MVKIFETPKIKDLDQYTIDHEPISSIDLIERAASAFVYEFCRHHSKQNRVVLFAGQGNNGADALAIARLLADEGYQTETYLFNPTQLLSADCEENKQRLLSEKQARLIEVVEDFTPPILTNRDVVIDGLFGSGLNRPLSGGYASVVNYINQCDSTVIAIDIPSGLFGENNVTNDPDTIICANETYTFEFPKLALMFQDNAPFVGKWKVLPVGIHPTIMQNTQTSYMMITEEDMEDIIRTRSTFDHKGTFGHAFLIAGSVGKMGAAALAAKACMRSGAGRLTVHTPQRGETILQTLVPEAMLDLDKHTDYTSEINEINSYEAIAVGPGLGVNKTTLAFLESLLKASKKPLILDADALNIIAAHQELLDLIPPSSILTPHIKEFERMFGSSQDGFKRLQKAKRVAVERKLTLVLKGAYTATCTPEGNVYFNSSGNPGMATAGSGDVLTGIILGFLAQGYSPETSAVMGTYVHGMAGDLVLSTESEESLIAGDLVKTLGKVFKILRNEN